MKYFSILLLSMIFSITVSGKIKPAPTVLHMDESGAWTYEKIIDIPNTAKDELYNRVRTWMLTNIKTADKNSLTDDPSHEMLTTTAVVALGDLWTLYTDVTISFKITVQFKDNKARFTAGAFTYYAVGTSSNLGIKNTPLENYEDEKGIVKKINERIDERFPAFMTKAEASVNKKSNDW
jgi:hypothetical protein